jgi:hypothetical protein
LSLNVLGLGGCKDWQLMARIRSEDYTFVTNNRTDFAAAGHRAGRNLRYCGCYQQPKEPGRFGVKIAVNRIGIGALWIATGLSVWALDDPRGHWSGSVEVPNQILSMEVDLDKGPNGWIGSISIPEQKASGIPLDTITFANGKCTFHLKGAPGDPTFTGTLSADGKTMTGDFTQGPGTFPFKFSRTGDPKVDVAKASPAVAKDFLGTWEGTLEGPGLRLVLKMSNDGGGAKAVLISVDQGGTEIPVSAIDQKDAKLTLLVKMVGGQYEAEINKEGSELNGTWTQGGNGLPLKLKKAAAQDEKH